MKKIISTIMTLVMSVTLLAGCNLFVHNYEKDYMQVVATIQPITESGVREDGTPWSYTSEKKEILKQTLVNYVNTEGMNSINAGLSVSNTVNNLLDQIIESELLLVEAEILFEKGDIAWKLEDIEEIKKNVYTYINNDLFTIYNQILEERDEPLLTEPVTEDATATYPLFENDYPDDEDEAEPQYYEGELGQYHDEWYLDTEWYIEDESKYGNTYPGLFGSVEDKSLGREAMKRLITIYTSNANNFIGITKEEQKQIDNDVKRIEEIEETEGAEYVYPILGRTTLIKKLYGDTFIKQAKMTMLEESITKGITVSEQEIVQKYNSKLSSQMTDFDQNVSNYHSAVTGSEKQLILYNPDNHYVYVKHILLPFSEKRQQELQALESNVSPEKFKQELLDEVSRSTFYPHVDGEDDKTRPMTADQIFNEVSAEMSQLAASPMEAERKMNEFIYKYNTDPGIFANDVGYAVKYKLDEGEKDTYMEAFANGAREFRDNGYAVGELLDHYVVTSYGVHIMYYAGDTSKKVLGINDYQTAGRYNTVYDLIEDELLAQKNTSAITNWQETRIYYHITTAKKVSIKKKVVNGLIKQITG